MSTKLASGEGPPPSRKAGSGILAPEMAAAQDTPGTPGREDTGLGLGSDPSFAGALATGTDAPEDPWARVAEQLEWEDRRGASLAPNPSAPLLAALSATESRLSALPLSAAASPAADLPTKPALPEAPAQYVKWRAQAIARGLRSVFVTAADEFTSAPPPSPGLWLLAAPPEVQAIQVAIAVPVPSLAPADRALVAPSPSLLPAVTSAAKSRSDPAPEAPVVPPGLAPLPPGQRPGGLLGAVQRPDSPRPAEKPPAQEPASSAVTAAPPQLGLHSPVRRPGGLLGAVQRPVSSRSPEKPPAPEPAPAAASSSPLSEARLGTLAARADQVVRQSVQRGKTLLRRLLGADQRAAPPPPPSPTEPDSD